MGIWQKIADWAVPDTAFHCDHNRLTFVSHTDEPDPNGQFFILCRCNRCGRTIKRMPLIGSDLARLGR